MSSFFLRITVVGQQQPWDSRGREWPCPPCRWGRSWPWGPPPPSLPPSNPCRPSWRCPPPLPPHGPIPTLIGAGPPRSTHGPLLPEPGGAAALLPRPPLHVPAPRAPLPRPSPPALQPRDCVTLRPTAALLLVPQVRPTSRRRRPAAAPPAPRSPFCSSRRACTWRTSTASRERPRARSRARGIPGAGPRPRPRGAVGTGEDERCRRCTLRARPGRRRGPARLPGSAAHGAERRAPSRPFPAAGTGRRRRVPSFRFVPGRRRAARFYVCRNKGAVCPASDLLLRDGAGGTGRGPAGGGAARARLIPGVLFGGAARGMLGRPRALPQL